MCQWISSHYHYWQGLVFWFACMALTSNGLDDRRRCLHQDELQGPRISRDNYLGGLCNNPFRRVNNDLDCLWATFCKGISHTATRSLTTVIGITVGTKVATCMMYLCRLRGPIS
ncbi:hypothetical protein BDU57DRAFT_312234 [Ampelomyces quisqualis]|uniref:Uncharacterized protein n=1 Tax=Ampelomyces quisqualis TaxID=50730 RepID=A0A6A5QFD5_AMPQU|nr:hypothetical protein BDU57DRAFT_312234 [Ampelomyces quisqualis]